MKVSKQRSQEVKGAEVGMVCSGRWECWVAEGRWQSLESQVLKLFACPVHSSLEGSGDIGGF